MKIKSYLLATLAMSGMMAGSLAPMPIEIPSQARELRPRPAPAPERLAPISGQTETTKERFDRLRGTTPRRGRGSGSHRSADDRAHKRMKARRAASHHQGA